MNINSNAPAMASAEVLINAPLELVWNLQTDIASWPTWNKAVKSMELRDSFRVGTEFHWVAGGMRIISRIEEIVPMQRIVWTGKTIGIKAIHVWVFENRNGGSYVHTEESFEGIIVRLLSVPMRKMLAKSLEQGLSALRDESERRVANVVA